jgi:hypothetical protein
MFLVLRFHIWPENSAEEATTRFWQNVSFLCVWTVRPHHVALHISKMRYVDNTQLEIHHIVETLCLNRCDCGSYVRNLNRDSQLHNYQTKSHGPERQASFICRVRLSIPSIKTHSGSACSPEFDKAHSPYKKNTVFWDVASCRSCVNRRFGETYRLEGGGDTFLQIVGSHNMYAAPHPRRRYSSGSLLCKHQILHHSVRR